MAKIINGKVLAATIQKQLHSEVSKMKDVLRSFQPGLAIVQVSPRFSRLWLYQISQICFFFFISGLCIGVSIPICCQLQIFCEDAILQYISGINYKSIKRDTGSVKPPPYVTVVDR